MIGLKNGQTLKTLIFSILMMSSTYGYSQIVKTQYIKEPSNGRQHYFGSSGDIDGDRAVICAVHSFIPGSKQKGAAYVYQLNMHGDWVLTRSMFPKTSNWDDRFAQNACAISGDFVVVGDWRNQKQECGAAYVFKLEQDTLWQQMAKLIPRDTNGITGFGLDVEVDKNTIIAGSYQGVHIFELDINNKWKETQVLKMEGGFGFTGFKLFDDVLVVSAQYKDTLNIKNIGAVYVYHRLKNKKWKLLQIIVPPIEDHKEDLEFGNSLSLFNNTLAIAADRKDIGEIASSGMVFIYHSASGNKPFSLSQKVYASDFGFNKYHFGNRVAINDDYLIVSRSQERDYQSSIYFFENVDGKYVEQKKIYSPEQEQTNSGDFGNSAFALSANKVLVGMSDDEYCDEEDGGCGSAYFYTLEKKAEPSDKSTQVYIPANITEKQMKLKMKAHKADSIIFDNINQDDVYLLRNKSTHLWGMFQSGHELIPMEYEQIEFYDWNMRFTFVKQNGKWGIYGPYSMHHLNVSCIYDELQHLNYKELKYVAAKYEGKWMWLNWYDGNVTSDRKSYYQELQVYKNWNPGDYSEENFHLYFNR